MKLISNLSAHVLIIIIKSKEKKIKAVKWCFLNFNLNSQKFAECKITDFYGKSKFQHELNLQRVLFCPSMICEDIKRIDSI